MIATQDQTARAAQWYGGDLGWAIIPCHVSTDGRCSCGDAKCRSPGKHPRTANGVYDASTDSDTIAAWWDKWPNANVAIAWKANGVLILDIDKRHGGDLAAIRHKLPSTPIAKTGNGWHVYFILPDGIKPPKQIAKGYEFPAVYAILPPSVHPSGAKYEWLEGCEPSICRLAVPPDWLLDEIRTKKKPQPKPGNNGTPTVGNASLKTIGKAAAYMAKVPPAMQGDGGHDATFRTACYLARDFALSVDQSMPLFLEWNRKCQPPWQPSELRQMLEDALEYGGGENGTEFPIGRKVAPADTEADARNASASEIISKPLSDYEPRSIEWLWPSRIPIGKLVIVQGNPEVGKSYTMLDAAARITTGRCWPDCDVSPERGRVVLLSSEDDPHDTIRPRFDRLGGDATMVDVIEAVRVTADGEPRALALERDIAVLQKFIERKQPRLVTIDPITDYFIEANANRENEVRQLLAPLAATAEKYRTAVVLIMHLNKRADLEAIHRGLGAVGWGGKARMVWMACKDPDDADRRLFLPVKNNICAPVAGLAYKIDDEGVLRWFAEPVNRDVDDVLRELRERERPQLAEAENFLRDKLKDGPVAKKDLERMAADDDISSATLRRAKKLLSVDSRKSGAGSGAYWAWSLPPEAVQTLPI